jgi:hypothetical protein
MARHRKVVPGRMAHPSTARGNFLRRNLAQMEVMHFDAVLEQVVNHFHAWDPRESQW